MIKISSLHDNVNSFVNKNNDISKRTDFGWRPE